MRALFFSDVHWNTNTSIVRGRGEKYSVRLELLINSMNFVNKIAEEKKCDFMVCAGDYFNKAQATDEEITAVQEVVWNNLPCYFLCGNHESSVNDLRFSTLQMLASENRFIISKPCNMVFQDSQFHFVPYVTESDRLDLTEYLNQVDKTKKQIVISHNDIQGIQYGGFESKSGFKISEIEENCDLYLNGHLHNSEWITKKILNLGSFSCHNFTNDSFRYKYGVWVLDTEDMSMEFIDNPYGLNFYNISVNSKKDLKIISELKNNSVLSISCAEDFVQDCAECLEANKNKIVDKRMVVVRDVSKISGESNAAASELRGIDHIEKLISFCKENIDNTAVLMEELQNLSK